MVGIITEQVLSQDGSTYEHQETKLTQDLQSVTSQCLAWLGTFAHCLRAPDMEWTSNCLCSPNEATSFLCKYDIFPDALECAQKRTFNRVAWCLPQAKAVLNLSPVRHYFKSLTILHSPFLLSRKASYGIFSTAWARPEYAISSRWHMSCSTVLWEGLDSQDCKQSLSLQFTGQRDTSPCCSFLFSYDCYMATITEIHQAGR